MIKDWTKQEILDIYNTPLLELISKAAEVHKTYHKVGEVQVSSLLSIKTGGLPRRLWVLPASGTLPHRGKSS